MIEFVEKQEEYPQPGKYIVYRGPNFIAHSCPSYRMIWKDREYFLDWHPFCGPSRLKKNGDPFVRPPGEKHPFWDGISAWIKAGQKADSEGNCIMQEQAN